MLLEYRVIKRKMQKSDMYMWACIMLLFIGAKRRKMYFIFAYCYKKKFRNNKLDM